MLVPSKVFCATAISGATPLIRRKVSEPSSIAKLTGSPSKNRQQEGGQHDAKCGAIIEMQRRYHADRVNKAHQQCDDD